MAAVIDAARDLGGIKAACAALGASRVARRDGRALPVNDPCSRS